MQRAKQIGGAILQWLIAPFLIHQPQLDSERSLEDWLLRCPFCGAKQGRISVQTEQDITCASAPQFIQWHRVVCCGCGVHMPGALYLEDAVEQWNRRSLHLVDTAPCFQTRTYVQVLEALSEAGYHGPGHFQRSTGVGSEELIGRSWSVSDDRVSFQD